MANGKTKAGIIVGAGVDVMVKDVVEPVFEKIDDVNEPDEHHDLSEEPDIVSQEMCRHF